MDTSTPKFSEFYPHIEFQKQVIARLRAKGAYDYEMGVPEILLSGAVGSAKSLLAAHIAISHCLMYAGARVGICRRALPDLKRTLYLKCKEHLVGDPKLPQNLFYVSDSRGAIVFYNKSELVPISWADGKSEKVRSLELSGCVIEEATENKDKKDRNTLKELKMRVGRLPHVPENFIIYATNPDGPSHWMYDYFSMGNPEARSPTMFVYYSKTRDNPFLPDWYADQLERDLDPKTARRMIHGEWLDMDGEGVYHAYRREKNFVDKDYEPNPAFPIICSWDFNIAEGKPMSVAIMQYINDTLHIFDEVVVHGMRTLDSCEAVADKGYHDKGFKLILTGDAAGKHKDTRSKRSDYDIIEKYFANLASCSYTKLVFPSNSPIRKRHNLVNAYCENAKGDHRLFIYRKAPTADKALQRTVLKNNSYIEDDGPNHPYQHIGTAIGYGLRTAKHLEEKTRRSGNVQF